MKNLKRCFFVLVFGLLLGTAATFACSTECQADNAGTYGFFIVHSTDCLCGNNNVSNTVILGSTHKYEIMTNTNVEFDHAVWGMNPEFEPNDSNITIPYEEMGRTITICFAHDQNYTLRATMTAKDGKTYESSLNINVVDQYFDDEHLYIIAQKGETVSITPQFRLFSKEYPYGTLTTITEDIAWSTSSISSMNPSTSDGELVFTPDQSGEYRIYVQQKIPDPSFVGGFSNGVSTSYTIIIPEKEIETGKSISSSGQENEYVSFTPNVTGRYKINWKAYSNSGYESLYSSNGQVSRIDDYLGGYWLTKGETYCMKLYYKTPTNSNSYSIDLYTDEDSDSSTPDPTPSVPSGQPSQGADVDDGNSNTGNVINDTNNTAAPTQTVSVSKVKGKPKLKLKKGKVKLTFKKVKGADGYEIRYATNKKFKKSKKITVKSPKATLKKLKKGKKYFVKIRAFKRNAASQKVYGAYSKVVKINLK